MITKERGLPKDREELPSGIVYMAMLTQALNDATYLANWIFDNVSRKEYQDTHLVDIVKKHVDGLRPYAFTGKRGHDHHQGQARYAPGHYLHGRRAY